MLKNADEFAMAQEMAALIPAVIEALTAAPPLGLADPSGWDAQLSSLREHLVMLRDEIHNYTAQQRAGSDGTAAGAPSS